MKFSLLMYLREAFYIRRFHTVAYTAVPNSVGHHTAGVIANLYYLYDDAPPIGVIYNALFHDMLELATGDIPAPAKWRDAKFAAALTTLEQGIAEGLGIAMAKTTQEDVNLLHLADMMDLCFKAVDEITVGNGLFFPILVNGVVYCRNLIRTELKNHKKAQTLFEGLLNNPHVNIMEIVDESAPIQH